MSKYLPTTTGGQEAARVVPGPVRGGHCPPPREIVVIEARKVFDFCTQEDMLERCFFVSGVTTGSTVTSCEITNVSCQEILDREPIPDDEGKALVSIQVNLTLSLVITPPNNGTPIRVQRNIAFPKRVVLCAPMGTDISCDVRGTCICTIQPPQPAGAEAEPNVCCTIQLSVTLTSTANVKVLVPSLGMVLPKECTVAPVLGVTTPPDCEEPVGRLVDTTSNG